MHATDVNDFLNRFIFRSDTLSIVYIDKWQVLVTLCITAE